MTETTATVLALLTFVAGLQMAHAADAPGFSFHPRVPASPSATSAAACSGTEAAR